MVNEENWINETRVVRFVETWLGTRPFNGKYICIYSQSVESVSQKFQNNLYFESRWIKKKKKRFFYRFNEYWCHSSSMEKFFKIREECCLIYFRIFVKHFRNVQICSKFAKNLKGSKPWWNFRIIKYLVTFQIPVQKCPLWI